MVTPTSSVKRTDSTTGQEVRYVENKWCGYGEEVPRLFWWLGNTVPADLPLWSNPSEVGSLESIR